VKSTSTNVLVTLVFEGASVLTSPTATPVFVLLVLLGKIARYAVLLELTWFCQVCSVTRTDVVLKKLSLDSKPAFVCFFLDQILWA